MSLADTVIAKLKEPGYAACVVSFERLAELEAEYTIITSRKVWQNSPHLSQHKFDFKPPQNFHDAKSVFVVAVPVIPIKLGFTRLGRHYTFEVPPLSTDHDDAVEDIVASILDIISAQAYRLAVANIPTKLLASHTGLLENGYNNMGYINGMGSFFRLIAFFSDMPSGVITWGEHRVSRSCGDCRNCIEACPTSCLRTDGYDVSRCLSLLSKEPSDFPEWVHRRWHNSLIGCRICQRVCPMNQTLFNKTETTAEFNESETTAILTGIQFENLTVVTQGKLRNFHLAAYYDILPRNLRLLLGTEQE